MTSVAAMAREFTTTSHPTVQPPLCSHRGAASAEVGELGRRDVVHGSLAVGKLVPPAPEGGNCAGRHVVRDPQGQGVAPLQRDSSQKSSFRRERELAELDAGLTDALSGHGRLFLLSGEPGMGKIPAIVENSSARSASRGAIVAAAQPWWSVRRHEVTGNRLNQTGPIRRDP